MQMDSINDWRSLSSSSSCNYYNKIDIINSDVDQMMIIEDHEDLRRGPWTTEEDLILINYISIHGERRWNSLARCAGLKRTGKSCRLRWLNYLRPDVRRGNITLEEQLLILELHSRWGNRWSKIAQHLPGRTDNEIKNYWRTHVQKHAKQLKCDVNSKQFKDTMRCLWMPRLVERVQAATSSVVTTEDYSENANCKPYFNTAINNNNVNLGQVHVSYICTDYIGASQYDAALPPIIGGSTTRISYTNDLENSTPTSSDSFGAQVSSSVSNLTHKYKCNYHADYNISPDNCFHLGYSNSLVTPSQHYNINNGGHIGDIDFQALEQNNQWTVDDDDAYVSEKAVWSDEDIWLLEQQFNITI